MTVSRALRSRRSAKAFDSTTGIDNETIEGLIRLANLAPSVLNLQPWRYRILTDREGKERLSEACFGQQKVADASAAVVLLGDTRFFEDPTAYESGEWQELGLRIYQDENRVRDELFRCGGLWAMAFLLAAEDAGWDSAPIGGFEPAQVRMALGIEDRYLPILILLIGKNNKDLASRQRRRLEDLRA